MKPCKSLPFVPVPRFQLNDKKRENRRGGGGGKPWTVVPRKTGRVAKWNRLDRQPVGQRNWQGFRLFREGVSCHSAFLSRGSRATSTNLATVKAYRNTSSAPTIRLVTEKKEEEEEEEGRRSNKTVPPRFRRLDSWWRTPPRSITGAIHFRSPRRLTNWLFVNLHLKRGGQARIAHRGIDFFPPCLGDWTEFESMRTRETETERVKKIREGVDSKGWTRRGRGFVKEEWWRKCDDAKRDEDF